MLKSRKTFLNLILIALFCFSANIVFSQQTQSELARKITALNGVTNVTQLEEKREEFTEKYAVKITQMINPDDPSVGTFEQLVYVCHVGFDAPTMVVTDGYTASFGANPYYTEELAFRYKANIIAIQHRYFDESTPDDIDWKYMRGKYAATDMHNITNTFKNIYKGKYFASGVSKGGQNTMIYASYYPDDMEFYVPYVGPICFGVEDGRHEKFIPNIGTEQERAKIHNFQREVLTRRKNMVSQLKKYADEHKINFKGVSYDEILDLSVLEFEFAIWQMHCENIKDIPATNATDKELFDFLMKYSDPSYFANADSTSPFFVQAAMELGYYGYDTKPLKDLLTIKNTKGYLKRVIMAKEFSGIKFNSELYKHLNSFLKKNDTVKMMFIYGEYDPWSAVAPKAQYFEKKENMMIYYCPEYDHKSRIRNFPADTQKEIYNTLDEWLKGE